LRWRLRRDRQAAVFPDFPDEPEPPGPDSAELNRELLAGNALRTQALAERLLLRIEDAERGEENPERLSFLFQLDHLATRLRRESERQLLFADRLPTPMHPEPLALTDVLRITVGHCSDYRRVHLTELPSNRLENALADDLAHLLAELIDNSLALSPAQARVRLSGCELGSGGMLIQVDDEGIGMDETLLAELNMALREPALPGDVSVPHSGLRLVGSIAQRHGLQVRLYPGIPRGVSAQVMIPPESVYPPAPVAAAAPGGQAAGPVPPGGLGGPVPSYAPMPARAPGQRRRGEVLPRRDDLPRRPDEFSPPRWELPDPDPGDVERAMNDGAAFSEGWEGPWQA